MVSLFGLRRTSIAHCMSRGDCRKNPKHDVGSMGTQISARGPIDDFPYGAHPIRLLVDFEVIPTLQVDNMFLNRIIIELVNNSTRDVFFWWVKAPCNLKLLMHLSQSLRCPACSFSHSVIVDLSCNIIAIKQIMCMPIRSH